MPPQLIAALKRAGTQVNGMTLGQKVIAVVGIGVLLLGGSAFATWAAKPDYVTAFPGLSAADAGATRDALVAVNIPAELNGSSVDVPADQVDEAIAQAAQVGLPKGQTSGSGMLEGMGITTSQFQQKVAYQTALQSKIGESLTLLDGVQTAAVQLAVPDKTVFEDEKQPVTAAVVVDTGTHDATTDEVNAMVSLVSNSVPDLKPANVSITDATGTLLTDGATGSAGKREELTSGYEQKMQTKVQSVLDEALGAGKAITTVNATLNMDATNRASTTYTPSGALPTSETEKKETYSGTGAATGGALGANGVFGVDGTSTTAGATGTDGSTYVKSDRTTDAANNVVVDSTVVAPGDVERQSVAVVVDQKALEAFGGQQNLQTLLTTAVGFDQNRGDVVSVTPATFDTTAKDAAAAALKAAAAEEKSQEQFALIKQAAIALGVLLLAIVLLVAWRRAVKKGKREAVDLGELERLYPESPAVPGGAAYTLPAAHDAHLLTAPEPEPEALRRQEFGQLVDTQPAEVANLLRGWLAASKKG